MPPLRIELPPGSVVWEKNSSTLIVLPFGSSSTDHTERLSSFMDDLRKATASPLKLKVKTLTDTTEISLRGITTITAMQSRSFNSTVPDLLTVVQQLWDSASKNPTKSSNE